jgi:hypothetical protein
MLAGRQPPNGKTLALLCLKSVKHPDQAINRRQIRKSMQKLRKMPPPGGSATGFQRPVAGPVCYLAFVGVVSGVCVAPDFGITVSGRLVAGMSGL